MFGLEKLIYLHKGKYSLYFNSLTTSVLGLSFGLGLVCTNSASAFEFDKKLVAPDGAANDFFGTPRSVSLSGNTALVGSFLDDDRGTNSGSAYLFDVTTGELVRKLTAPDGAANDSFGGSVSLYGDTALVSSNVDDDKGLNSGSAYLFDVTTGNLLHKLTAPDGSGGDIFGISVSLSANTALIGSYRDDDKGTDSGSAYLFDFTTGDYLGKLKAPDGAAGDWFGYFVSLSGNTALVGSPFDDDKGTDSGSAYLFDVTTGNLLHKFTAPNGAAGDRFGFSVSLSGNNALVGSHFDDDKGTDSGSAYLFDVTTGNLLHKLTAPDGAAGDQFGFPVSLSDNTALIGGFGDDDQGLNSGSAYLFDVTTGDFLQKLTAPDGSAGDVFGASVSLSGDRALPAFLTNSAIAKLQTIM